MDINEILGNFLNYICLFFSVEHFNGDYFLYQGATWRLLNNGDYLPKYGYYYSPLFAWLFTPFANNELFWIVFVWFATFMAVYCSREMFLPFRILFILHTIMWALNGNADPLISWAMAWAWAHPQNKWSGILTGLCCFKPSFIWGAIFFTLWHWKEINWKYYLGLGIMVCIWWMPLLVLFLIIEGSFIVWWNEMASVGSWNTSTGPVYYIGVQYPWWWLWLYSWHGRVQINITSKTNDKTKNWPKIDFQI